MTTPTRAEMCADLARAMGIDNKNTCGCGVMGCAPCTDWFFHIPPNPFTE